MQRLVFTIKNVILGLAHKKLLNALVILSVAVGFLFPVYSISFMNYVEKNYGTPPFKDIEHTVVADVFMEAEEESIMEEKMLQWNEQITKAGFFVTYETVTEYKGDSFVGYATGCTSDFLGMRNTILVDGRFPTEEEMETGAKVCLVKSSSGRNYKIGSMINVGGTEFEIIGSFRDIRLFAGVLMPYKSLYPMVEKKTLQSVAYLQTEGEPDVSKIKSDIRSAVERVQYVESAADSEVPMMKQYEEYITKDFKQSSVILLFSIISFTLIIAGRMLNEQYVLGVKTAVGATRVQLFFDLLLQNYLLIQIGAAITLLAYQCLFMINDSEEFGLFDGTVVGIVEIACVAMTLFATCIAFIPILRQPVNALFRSSQE